jgi:autotransporter-associated beta strand protein
VVGAGSTWTNTGSLTVGKQGTGTLTIADGGAVRIGGGAGLAHIALQAGSTGTLTIGAAAGQPAVAPGTLEAGEVRFGAGTGTLNFNHTGTGYAFAPLITGAGTIEHRAGTTALTGDSSGFTGTTTVSGGALLVNGTLGMRALRLMCCREARWAEWERSAAMSWSLARCRPGPARAR